MPLGEVVSHDPKSVLMSPGAGPAPPGSVALPGLAGGGGGVSVTVSNGGGYSHQVSRGATSHGSPSASPVQVSGSRGQYSPSADPGEMSPPTPQPPAPPSHHHQRPVSLRGAAGQGKQSLTCRASSSSSLLLTIM